MTTPLGGTVAPGFEPVRDAFEGLFRAGAETGAALAVVHRGDVVVDLYGGWRDSARTRPFSPDTLVHVFSVGKAVVALGLVLLVDRGRVGLDDPVAAYWPEFAVAGKGGVTVRQVLAHAAGLPAFDPPVPASAAGDWAALAGNLAAAAPRWPAGTVVAEHATTYGHLVGELIRRVDGRTPGEFLRAEVAAPWSLELALGATPDEQARTAELEYAEPDWARVTVGPPGTLRHAALDNPTGWLGLGVLNSAAWRGAQVPAVNLHSTARSLARLYGGLLAGGVLGGTRLLRPETAAAIARPHAEGVDLLLGRHVGWGLGVQVEPTGEWGMGGIGGCDAFVDPTHGYAFAYVTRRLADHDRSEALYNALISALPGRAPAG